MQPSRTDTVPWSQFSCSVMSDSLQPMDCSTPGSPVHHQLPELTQTHVHWVGDAIQQSHSLLSPSPPPSVFPSIRVFPNESVLHISWPKYFCLSLSIIPPMNIQNRFPLGSTGLISFQSKGLSRVFSNSTVQKHQFFWFSAFFMVQISHPTWLLEKP